MKNFYFLNLDIPLFKNGITVADIPKESISILDQEKYISKDIFNFFNSLNLKILLVESFFKTTGAKGGIHVDFTGGDYVKLNWVFGDSNAKMIWYEPINTSPNDILSKFLHKTATNTSYILYHLNRVKEIERAVIKNPTLVQVGIPHNVLDVTEDRICVSIVIKDKNTNKRLTMSEAVDRFNSYIPNRN